MNLTRLFKRLFYTIKYEHDLYRQEKFKLKRYPRRVKEHKEKGCAYWKNEQNKLLCSFPMCACYPEWQWERREKGK